MAEKSIFLPFSDWQKIDDVSQSCDVHLSGVCYIDVASYPYQCYDLVENIFKMCYYSIMNLHILPPI